LPQKARELVNSGARTAQDWRAQERAMEFARLAQARAEQLPDQVTQLVNPPAPKRFGLF
jgi:hypothetical protein